MEPYTVLGAERKKGYPEQLLKLLKLLIGGKRAEMEVRVEVRLLTRMLIQKTDFLHVLPEVEGR
jgi:hypothetical protein